MLYPFLPTAAKKVIDSILKKFALALPSMVEKDEIVYRRPSITLYSSLVDDINSKTQQFKADEARSKYDANLKIQVNENTVRIGEGILCFFFFSIFYM
jgi:hypothetical protein